MAFQTVSLVSSNGAPELCPHPEIGPSTMVGAEDGRTKLFGWRLLGIFPIGLEEGGSAVGGNPAGCHGAKRIFAKPVRGFVNEVYLGGDRAYPDTTQLAVVRLGDLLIAAVPAEVTTMTGEMIKRAIRDSAGAHGFTPGAVVVMSLANGYISYVPTADEYTAQDYEGGSDLFGPGTAAFLATRLAGLAGQIAAHGGHSPPSRVTPFTVSPGEHVDLFKPLSDHPTHSPARRFLGTSCEGGVLTSRWVEPSPGGILPAEGQVVAIDSLDSKKGLTWAAAAWDDEPTVEVRRVKELARRKAVWEVRWTDPAPRDYVVKLLPRNGLPADSAKVTCP